MTSAIIFCPGFGFSRNFWQPLKRHFASYHCFDFADLYSQPQLKADLLGDYDKCIGIGHSLGFSKLINPDLKFDYLIGLNAFTNFLGYERSLRQKRRIEYNNFSASLMVNMDMSAFYHRCGINPKKSPEVVISSTNRIKSDLQLLGYSVTLRRDYPVLIINSDNDIIVPPALTYDNFAAKANVAIDILTGGKHGLGFVYPASIYERIMLFINDR